MTQIPLSKVKRDNSNIRKYSDPLWRALRKERFKPANPDPLTNEMAYEEASLRYTMDTTFFHDVEKFMLRLKPHEAEIFKLFLCGGRINQTEIAEIVGKCQASVSTILKSILKDFKTYYYPEYSETKKDHIEEYVDSVFKENGLNV